MIINTIEIQSVLFRPENTFVVQAVAV